VPLSGPDVVVLITNSNVRHELSASEYPVRRQQCEQAAQLLNCHKLRDASLAQLNGTMFMLCFLPVRLRAHIIGRDAYKHTKTALGPDHSISNSFYVYCSAMTKGEGS